MNNPQSTTGTSSESAATEQTSLTPLVSVIIATYNCHATIEQTIQSVISQDFAGKELIIIDGGSTDGTREIIKKHDQAIAFWSSEPDRGVYDAFNKGIARARGEWLYFLGADDRFIDETVLGQIFARPLPGKMIYGNVLLEGTGPIKRNNCVYDGKFTKLKLCLRNICHQAVFYHKSLFATLGNFDLQYPVLADYAFNLKAFAAEGTEPHYLETLIAVFWNEGISGHHTDGAFERDRPALIKQHCGFPYYLFFIGVKYAIRFVILVTGLLGIKTKWQHKKQI